MTDKERRVAFELADRVLATNRERIRRVVLYGSRAYGAAGQDSDFDLLIIERDPVRKREETLRLRRALLDVSFPVDLWVMGEQEFEETKDVVGGIAYPAHKFGVVLYEDT